MAFAANVTVDGLSIARVDSPSGVTPNGGRVAVFGPNAVISNNNISNATAKPGRGTEWVKPNNKTDALHQIPVQQQRRNQTQPRMLPDGSLDWLIPDCLIP